MRQWITTFHADDNGQDLIEYSLIICFLAIVGVFILDAGRPAINMIWTNASAHLNNAGSFANEAK